MSRAWNSRWGILAAMIVSASMSAPAALAQSAASPATGAAVSPYAEDFEAFWSWVDDNYAYFDVKQTDWAAVRSLLAPQAAAATDVVAFVDVLERAYAELYDAHAHLKVNTAQSPRLVPSDLMLTASIVGKGARIDAVRADSTAATAGLRPGMHIVAIDGTPVAQAIDAARPKTLKNPDPAADRWVLSSLLAGKHSGPVSLTVKMEAGEARDVTFTPGVERPDRELSWERHAVGELSLGSIRMHNRLGDSSTIEAFDLALEHLRDTDGLILDLRDTPSGGNTLIARGVMGRLIGEEGPYQRHEWVAIERETGIARIWTEWVEPRGPWTYAAPVVVLVGPWTGSVGEGLTIGLDGLRRAISVGEPMAGLVGAVSELTLPHSGFNARLPTEKLFHVDGTPREAFQPTHVVRQDPDLARDVVFEKAVELLRNQKR